MMQISMSLLEEWGVIETQEHLITFWQKHDWQMNKKNGNEFQQSTTPSKDDENLLDIKQ